MVDSSKSRAKSPLPPPPPVTSPLSHFQLPSFEPLDLSLTKGTNIPPPPPSPPKTPPQEAAKKSKLLSIETAGTPQSTAITSPITLRSPSTALAYEHSSIRRLMSFRSMSSIHSFKSNTNGESPRPTLSQSPSTPQLERVKNRTRRSSFMFGSKRKTSANNLPMAVPEEGRRSPPPRLPELSTGGLSIDKDVFGKIG